MRDPAPQPAIAELDALDGEACRAALAPLFEGAPRFLARLCADRPFGDAARLFERARAIARAIPEAEQLELIDAHPRLGAPPGSVSALSFVEQGYDRDAPRGAATGDEGAADRPRPPTAGVRPTPNPPPASRRPTSPASWSGSTRRTRRSSASATASSSRVARGRRCCQGSRRRSTPCARPRSSGRSTRSSRSPPTGTGRLPMPVPQRIRPKPPAAVGADR